MSISLSSLREAAGRSTPPTLRKSLKEALAKSEETAFLCHSHLDRSLALGLQNLLSENGWRLYIDWQDASMPAKPNRDTAAALKNRIDVHEWFLILATPNSMASRWCPWEIGFADAKKSNDHIILIDTYDATATYGSEYLGLYRRISETEKRGLGVFAPGVSENGLLLEQI